MNRVLLFLALVVGVVWGQVAVRPALVTDGPVLTRPTVSPVELQAAICLAPNTVTEAEESLDNPEDKQYEISAEESEKLLRELEAEGVEEEKKVAETRNADFAVPASAERALIKWPCPSPSSYCPFTWRRLTTLRYKGPCGVEYCRPLHWYNTYYAVCNCPTCLKGRGRCVPSGYRSRVLLAYCYSRPLGWKVRAVRVTLPSTCQCRSLCLG